MATGRARPAQGGGGCGATNAAQDGRSFPKFNPVVGRPSSASAVGPAPAAGCAASGGNTGCCRPHSVQPALTEGSEPAERQICCSAHPNVSSACCSARGPAMPRGPPRRQPSSGYRMPLPLGGNCGRPIPLASLKDIYRPADDVTDEGEGGDDALEGALDAEDADFEEGDVTATHSCPLSSASPEPRPCCCRRQPGQPQQLQVLLRAATVSGSSLADAQLTPLPTPDNANHHRDGQSAPLPPPQDKQPQSAGRKRGGGREGRRASAAVAAVASADATKPRRSATQPPTPPAPPQQQQQQQRRGSRQSLVQRRPQPIRSNQQQQQRQQQERQQERQQQELTRPAPRQQRPQSWRMPPPPSPPQQQQPQRPQRRQRSRSSPAPLYSPAIYNNCCRTSESGDDDNSDRWLALTPPLEQQQQQQQQPQLYHSLNSQPQSRQWQQQWQQQQRLQQWEQQQHQQRRRRQQQQQQPDPNMHIYRRPLNGLMRSRGDAGGRSYSVSDF